MPMLLQEAQAELDRYHGGWVVGTKNNGLFRYPWQVWIWTLPLIRSARQP